MGTEGSLPAAVLVGVLGGDVADAVVPHQADLLAVEAGHVDAEEELAVLLVEVVVAAAGVSLAEQAAREVEALSPGTRMCRFERGSVSQLWWRGSVSCGTRLRPSPDRWAG